MNRAATSEGDRQHGLAPPGRGGVSLEHLHMASLFLEVAVSCTKYNVKTRYNYPESHERDLVVHWMIVASVVYRSIVGPFSNSSGIQAPLERSLAPVEWPQCLPYLCLVCPFAFLSVSYPKVLFESNNVLERGLENKTSTFSTKSAKMIMQACFVIRKEKTVSTAE